MVFFNIETRRDEKTDRDWERWGIKEPYYGVLSTESYRMKALTESGRADFFSSGDKHVARVLDLLSTTFGETAVPRSILDFGCGVWRLAIPFAKNADFWVGVDVSASMLAEAGKNAAMANIKNIEFICSNGDLSKVRRCFDLVHSYIVLQHIPWRRGRRIICNLAEKVDQDGFLALHFLTSRNVSALIRAAVRFRYIFPPAHWFRNLIKRRPLFEPAMQMHIYNPEIVCADIARLGFDHLTLHTDPDIHGFGNVFLLAKKQ